MLSKWPLPIDTIDVESGYGTTRVNAVGPLDGTPVVLLPGGGATSTVWFANVAALALGYRVFAIDPMGEPGRSIVGQKPIRTVDDLMCWFDQVLETLEVTRTSMVGHGYGAMMALAYALHRPERVRALVLLDPPSCFAGMRLAYLLHAVPLLVRPTRQRMRSLIRWETQKAPLDADWLDLTERGTDFPSAKPVVPRRPKGNRWATLAADVTVVFAGDSKVHNSSRVADAVETVLPNAHTVILAGSSHHMLPMLPAGELDAVLLSALG
ncbi:MULTISPECIES: alpha/beta fold hydrolase [unclassified Rhodococcus (in: high G+C Gram-positive bacteria)]|uniref:alpha/beta fold hydrolase n=1 Tax=unclassified Rhodococcus (in: high G+C Gram-positive bacteria) TaxID=192944 RepID=UPI001FB561A0|nr:MULTISPECIES: alpha/beta fold hydrolase [unclassified Rhodococcus (in: high G+C Gram-positive bacteria)]MCJ0894001.1 alpha/beta hydrolase [Rhodococcus sp. ARC_M5]